MKVEVTEKHIRRGEPRQVRSCPVALALKEQMHKEVEAGPYDLFYLIKRKVAGEAVTPIQASRFMRAFDRGEKVYPFTFEVSFRRTRSM